MLYTNAPRVKAGSQWCDRADAAAADYLTKHGIPVGTEVPYEALLEEIGLADTLVALGAPHPRCKKDAEEVLKKYLLEVYAVARELSDRLGMEFIDLSKIINVKNREAQAKQLSATLRQLQYTTYDPVLDNLFFCLRMLLSTEENSVKAVFAGKRILIAWRLTDSEEDVYDQLVGKLRDLLRAA